MLWEHGDRTAFPRGGQWVHLATCFTRSHPCFTHDQGCSAPWAHENAEALETLRRPDVAADSEPPESVHWTRSPQTAGHRADGDSHRERGGFGPSLIWPTSLGTGDGPRPRKVSSAPAQVIVANDTPYVIDCCNGVARQLVFAGVPLRPDASFALPRAQPLAIGAQVRYVSP